ncbi:MAG: DUF3047 domain-containing protein, partial [Rubrivivax sp.]
MTVLVLLLAGCASAPEEPPSVPGEATTVISNPWASTSATAADGLQVRSPWNHFKLPGKTPSQFSYTRQDGRDVMAVLSAASASMMRREVRVSPADLHAVRFSWKVPALIAGADMTQREFDDSPVRVVLAFEGDRSKLSPRNAMLSELSRALTGEEMPYATLMYVWANEGEAGRLIVNPRTDRIRKLVVESGSAHLGQWRDYERDVRADFERAFGEPPGALVGIGIMTDSDNTRGKASAWYG